MFKIYILLDLLNKLINICIDKSLVPNSWTLELKEIKVT